MVVDGTATSAPDSQLMRRVMKVAFGTTLFRNIASGPRAGSAWDGLALGAPEPPGGNTGRGGRHRRSVCHVWRDGGGLLAQWCSKHVGSKNACSRLVRPGDK